MGINRKLRDAYKRLDYQEYKRIVKDTMVPYFDIYDGKFITIITPGNVITLETYTHNEEFTDLNIKVNGIQIDTEESKSAILKFIEQFSKPGLVSISRLEA